MRHKNFLDFGIVALNFAGVRRGSREKTFSDSILLAFGEITHFEGGGCDSLIKVGTGVWQVHNLGRAQFPPKNLMPGQKLTSEIPNRRPRTSVPTFIRESPPPPPRLILKD